MEVLWFGLMAAMLTAYAALDGFDLGAGIISPFVGRTADERHVILRTIGPVWDGNEVWLIAAGGGLFFAFPLVYAASFSGFYLSLMIVLWLLMLRGIGVELRRHVAHPLWWTLCDGLFFGSSALLAIFYGVAVGNVVRGVPLGEDRYFFEPLWTDFRVGPNPGLVDWYTVLTGIVALAALTQHGAAYVALKTEGAVNLRARRATRMAWIAVVIATGASLAATLAIRPELTDNFRAHPWGWAIPVVVAAALAALWYYASSGDDRNVFVASLVYIVAMLGGAAFALYPTMLHSSIAPEYSLTAHNAKTGAYSLRVGFIWWGLGIALAVGYFTFLYRSLRGKVTALAEEGY